MPENKLFRYPGLKPFATHEYMLFHGRGSDIEALTKIVSLENQLLLHSKSGLGKSSLLNAGLTPVLARDPDLFPIRIRFSAYQGNDSFSPLNMVRTRIDEETDQLEADLGGIVAGKDSLWYLFKQVQAIQKRKTTHILIFDQFEEIFTYPDAQIKRFKTELAGLLNNVVPKAFQLALEKKMGQEGVSDEILRLIYEPLPVKAIYAIRSDKLSLVDEFKDVLPDILSRTYRLLPLDRDRAEDAILNPAYQKGEGYVSPRFDFSDDALDTILDFLTKNGEQQVESFQLQIICQYVENIVIETGKTLIDCEEVGDIGDIFENYYEALITRLPREEDQKKARQLIEEGMILENEEIRLSLHEGQIIRDYEVSQDLLDQLVETRLIRAESSPRGGYIYELSHDTLIKPILKAKDRRVFARRIQEEHDKREAEARVLHEQEAKRQKRIFGSISTGFLIVLGLMLSFGYYKYQQQKVTEERLRAEATVDSMRQNQFVYLDSIQDYLDSLQMVLQELSVQQQSNASQSASAPSAKAEKAQTEFIQKVDYYQARLKQEQTSVNEYVIAELHDLPNEELVARLYSADQTFREKSYEELIDRFDGSQTAGIELVGVLLDYGIENNATGRKEGNWNILNVLENEAVKDAYLEPNLSQLETFLRALHGRYGAKTEARIERLAQRGKEIRQPTIQQKVPPKPALQKKNE